MRDFKAIFNPNLGRFNSHKLSEKGKERAINFSNGVVPEKRKEKAHQADGGQATKRYKNGIAGEIAVEEFLGVKYVDTTIGHSNEYRVADLKALGLNVGVKTVERGKFPLISKRPLMPEIIVVRDGDYFCICGVATKDCLINYQDDELVLSSNCRNEGKKSGFYGFNGLIPFRSLEELRIIIYGIEALELKAS